MLLSKSVRTFSPLLFLFALLLSGCALSSSSSTQFSSMPDQSAKLRALNDTAEAMYMLAKEGKFSEARDRLEQFTDQMTQITYKGITSPEGLNALTELVSESRRVYNRVSFSPEQGRLAAAKIRLAADALSHKEKPMWHGYRKVFREDAAAVGSTINEKNDVKAVRALQSFHRHYLIVRPAALLSRDPALIEKADSWFVFMNAALTGAQTDYAKGATGISHIDELIGELFGGREAATFGTSADDDRPIWMAAILSAVILTVLVYVGWKKYKFTQGWG